MPRKFRIVDKDSFRKAKMFYRNTTQKEPKQPPVFLNLDEYEALRLSYYRKLPQKECAQQFNISQPTYSRILKAGVEKLVSALVEGRDFEIVGGQVSYEWEGFGCWDCDHEWTSLKVPSQCPKCESRKIFPLHKLVSFFPKE
ncbi:MAG: DUF134 domain-containing protein [Promethearchaeota archaeon]